MKKWEKNIHFFLGGGVFVKIQIKITKINKKTDLWKNYFKILVEKIFLLLFVFLYTLGSIELYKFLCLSILS